jgi:hypothetical protein
MANNRLKSNLRKQRRQERKFERWYYANRNYSNLEINDIIKERDEIFEKTLKSL